jgi:RNA polymerase I-specific transcription initiation factor RRN3
LYCYTILDVNKRSEAGDSSPPRGAERNTTALRHSNVAELNTFFPFDPCRLPKSNGFIQGVYREWESVKIQGDDEDEDDDDEKDDDDKEGSDRKDLKSVRIGAHLAIPSKTSINLDEGLGESLGAMSISPAMVTKSVSDGIDAFLDIGNKLCTHL